MDSSEEMKKGISSPEDLETAKIEEGEIKDENTEAVTGGYLLYHDTRISKVGGVAPGRTPIA